MKKTVKFKVVDEVIITIPNGNCEAFKVGDPYRGETIGAFITNGDRVQFLNTRLEEQDPSVNPADYLIATMYGFPYTENYRWAEVEVDEPEETLDEAPAENEKVAQ